MVDPFHTHRILFHIASDSPLHPSGFCEYAISQHGVLEILQRIPFSVVHVPPAPEIQPEDTETCSAPMQLVVDAGKRYCVSPCTRDQVRTVAIFIYCIGDGHSECIMP